MNEKIILLFGGKTKTEAIRQVLKLTDKIDLAEFSFLVKAGYTNVHREVEKLEELGLVAITKDEKTSKRFIELNKGSALFKPLCAIIEAL